ncbi:AAA family ATPase [Streptomyces sp. NBC_00390]|uniref:AAA family ATPase n=1 Tax=Streptomyces sp. NBC_00390 TaxID=2975736 RepID=UPI002E23CE5A
MSETVVLCAVAGEHLLVIGLPGTAKSEAVRRVSQQLGGQLFEYVLGRFTEPNEIFGPVDLRRLREGVVEVETTGMLPEADVAFLDEVFLGSTAILNTLLGLLNERTFRRGSTSVDVPLRVCVGAVARLRAAGRRAAPRAPVRRRSPGAHPRRQAGHRAHQGVRYGRAPRAPGPAAARAAP